MESGVTKLAVVCPLVSMSPDLVARRQQFLLSHARAARTIDFLVIERGPQAIESRVDEAVAVPGVLQKCVEAERRGYDGIIVWCAGDPGVAAARELVGIPVVGPGEASLLYASATGHRFSVLVPFRERGYLSEELARNLGFSARLASVRGIEMGVIEIRTDTVRALALLEKEGAAARDQDRAHVLVLGCLSMIGMARELSARLGMPVIDPALAALNLAESLVSMGLSHSRIGYPPVPDKDAILAF